jgi:hypothetical protein
MAQRLRVFISSPGDVRKARLAAARTVETVAQDYLRHFNIEPYLWETEALLSSGHFQDTIEPPSGFDIVVLILWSRLGTVLPEETAVRSYRGIDGRAPVTGTEWEYEDALRAARDKGVPDLLVYRSREQANIDAWDPARRQDQLEQLGALDRFWSRHFADRGTFIGAYHEFSTLEALAASFETHLRQLIERRIAELEKGEAGRAAPERVWARAPFIGLQSYGYEHAPIFFGRAEAVGRALGQLIGAAEAGPAFLLLLGASGSGKSSLAKAGVAPRLTLPRRVIGKAFVRRIAFRPSDTRDGEDIFDALARALLSGADGEPGLPGLGAPARLARLLREAPKQASLHIEPALDALTTKGQADGALPLNEQAALLLIVDQLEELYTDQRIAPADRQTFIAIVEALAAGGRAWVMATMRADLWHRAGETPALVDLAAGLGRFDLLAPRPSEISQMVRLPAEAAAIDFEHDPESGVPLNDQITEDAASAPGVLPLLSYVLEQLYQTDVIDHQGSRLTWASYRALGGLKGAIAARAEAILADQPESVRGALRQVLFSLVQVTRGEGGGETIAARRTPLAGFGADSNARRLVDAFLDPRARLLFAEEGEGGPVVRVAHEALLTEWARARRLIADDAALLGIRRTTEERFARWRDSPGDQGLLTGLDLDDARRLARDYGGGLLPELTAYIERSAQQDRRRRRRATVVLASIAGVMTVLAAISGIMTLVALHNEARVQTQLMDRNLLVNEHDGDAARRAGDFPLAIAKYAENVAIASKLVKREPDDIHWLFNLANAHGHLGMAYAMRAQPGDGARARAEYASAMQAAGALAKLDGLTSNSGAPRATPEQRDRRARLQQWLARQLAD